MFCTVRIYVYSILLSSNSAMCLKWRLTDFSVFHINSPRTLLAAQYLVNSQVAPSFFNENHHVDLCESAKVVWSICRLCSWKLIFNNRRNQAHQFKIKNCEQIHIWQMLYSLVGNADNSEFENMWASSLGINTFLSKNLLLCPSFLLVWVRQNQLSLTARWICMSHRYIFVSWNVFPAHKLSILYKCHYLNDLELPDKKFLPHSTNSGAIPQSLRPLI